MCLYKLALELINQTKMWEKSIEITEKMEAISAQHLKNYEELSYIVGLKSKYCSNIFNQERIFPNYFKINFVNCDYTLSKSNVTLIIFKYQFKKQVEYILLAKDLATSSDIFKEMKKLIPDLILIRHNNDIEQEILQCFLFYFFL